MATKHVRQYPENEQPPQIIIRGFLDRISIQGNMENALRLHFS